MEEKQEFKFVNILDSIKKRFRLILIITILSTITSGILSYYGSKPVYKTSTSILVGNNSGEEITPSDLVMDQSLSKIYVEIAMSKIVAEAASGNLKDGTTALDIQKSVVVNNVKDTPIITIYAKAMTAISVADIVNAFTEAFIDESQKLLPTGNIQIIDKASVPEVPINSNKIKEIVIALLLGLLSSILIALFLEYLDDTVKTKKDVEKYINTSVIGVIPKTKKSELIVNKNSESLASQAYRTLRTNTQFVSKDKILRSILITSAGCDEGKTTVAANLALTIAQSGKNVILIDCDLRKPSIHNMFNVYNRKGLSDIIIENSKSEDIIINISENLDIITTGDLHSNPSEMLTSPRMSNFLKEIENKYDRIIIDSPAVLAVTDAQVLSTLVDGVIFVVGSYQSSIESMKKSSELLKMVNANIIGAVLNKTTHKSESLNGCFNDKTKKNKTYKKVEKRVKTV